MSALVDVGLVPAVDITGVVFASFIGSVSSGAEYELIFFLKAIPCHVAATIVRGHDDECIVGDACFLHGLDHLADGPVGLHDEVTVGANRAFALEIFGGRNRGVRAGQGHVEEEWLLGFCLLGDIGDGLFGDYRKHIDGFEVGMSHAFAEEFFLGGAFTDKALILDPNVRWHIQGRRDAVEIIKADAVWAVGNLCFPVNIIAGLRWRLLVRRGHVHTQMPFAEHAGGVAVFLQHGGNGLSPGLNQRGAKPPQHDLFEPTAPVVTPGEHAVTGGSAHCGRAVRVHKLHALPGQAVHVRGLDLAAVATVGLHIPQSPVICENENHIGLRRACTSFGRPRACTLVVRPLLRRGGLALRALGRRSLKRAQRSEKQKRYGEAIEFHFFSLFAAVGRMGV